MVRIVSQASEEYLSLCEKTKASTETYHGPLLHVYHDRVILPNGKESGRDYIKHLGAVCMVPVLDNGNVIVERQYRYPLDMVITEIPAGKLDSPTEDRLEAAKRELLEETGYVGKKWTYLGDFFPAVAYSNERISMYLVQELIKGERHLDEGEFINLMELPLCELVEQAMAGELVDIKTQAAILRAARILGV